MSSRLGLSIAAIVAAAGCSSQDKQTQTQEVTTFPVALQVGVADPTPSSEVVPALSPNTLNEETAAEGAEEESWQPTGTSWEQIYKKEKLRLFLTQKLAQSGLFTVVTEKVRAAEDDGGLLADVVLTVRWENLEAKEYPFGEGENLVGGSTISTFAWLFAGFSSWWVVNRQFPATGETAPTLHYELMTQSKGREIKSFGAIELRELGSSLIDRHDWKWACLWSVVLPPWVPPGIIPPDRDLLTESLSERASEAVRTTLIQGLRFSFGDWYAREVGTVLLIDQNGGVPRHATIASRDPVLRVWAYDDAGEAHRIVDFEAQRGPQYEATPADWQSLKRFCPHVEKPQAIFRNWYSLDLVAGAPPVVDAGQGQRVILLAAEGEEVGRQPPQICRWTIPVPGS